jgi:ankyrin repeat protein
MHISLLNKLFFIFFSMSSLAMETPSKPRAFYGDIKGVSNEALDICIKNIDLKEKNSLPGNYTFLHLAGMLHAYDEAYTILLANKYSVNDCANEKGLTPLLVACYENDAAMAQLFLSSGANPALASKTGMTPLIKAVQKGNIHLIKVLLFYGADIDQKDEINDNTPLHEAIRLCDSNIVSFLLNKGASPDLDLKNCFTPLMAALQIDIGSKNDKTHCLRIVQALLAKNANHAVVCLKKNDTALHFAVDQCNRYAVYLLLAAGANPNVLNANSETPLHIALHNILPFMHSYKAMKKRAFIARLLLSYGGDLSGKQLDYTKINPDIILRIGIVTQMPELVRFSLSIGANANAKNTMGNAPLHVLALLKEKNEESFGIALLLLGHGANIMQLNSEKNTTLDLLIHNMCTHDDAVLWDKITNTDGSLKLSL